MPAQLYAADLARSGATISIIFQVYIQAAFSNNYQVNATYINFSKVFDRIDNGLLITKLKSYGITSPLLRWFESYLSAHG